MLSLLTLLLLQAAADLPPALHEAPAPRRKVVRKTVRRIVRKVKPTTVVLTLYHVNRREKLVLRSRSGVLFERTAQRVFNRFMRCHHTGRSHAMSPRLLVLLAQIASHYVGSRIDVVSGYRAPSAARNPKSPHKRGLAADIRVVGVDNADLRDYLRRAFHRIGVGFYPNSSFVHVDVDRKVSAFWIDYAGPGENPRYSSSPVDDLRSGRAEGRVPVSGSDGSEPLDPYR